MELVYFSLIYRVGCTHIVYGLKTKTDAFLELIILIVFNKYLNKISGLSPAYRFVPGG